MDKCESVHGTKLLIEDARLVMWGKSGHDFRI
jgi:hypothetical protein